MVHIDRRAGVCLFLLALVAVSAPAGAKKPVPGPVIPKEILDPAPAPPAPPSNPPPTAPEGNGWPHTILSGYSTDCSREPGPEEVIVYKDRGFSGRCALLKPGFYPRADNFLVGNDAISGVKVGSAVRLRAFKDSGYAGGWEIFGPGTRSAGIGALHDEISSLRVEPADRSANCDDLRSGEIALFHHPHFQGDCVVLPGRGSYSNADNMGIRNDSISSIHNNSRRELQGFWNPQFSQLLFICKAHQRCESLPEDSTWLDAANDSISSVRMLD